MKKTNWLLVILMILIIFTIRKVGFFVARTYGWLQYYPDKTIRLDGCGSRTSGGENDCVTQIPYFYGVEDVEICQSIGGKWISGNDPPCIMESCSAFTSAYQITKANVYCNGELKEAYATRAGCSDTPEGGKYVYIANGNIPQDYCQVTWELVWSPKETATTTITTTTTPLETTIPTPPPPEPSSIFEWLNNLFASIWSWIKSLLGWS